MPTSNPNTPQGGQPAEERAALLAANGNGDGASEVTERAKAVAARVLSVNQNTPKKDLAWTAACCFALCLPVSKSTSIPWVTLPVELYLPSGALFACASVVSIDLMCFAGGSVLRIEGEKTIFYADAKRAFMKTRYNLPLDATDILPCGFAGVFFGQLSNVVSGPLAAGSEQTATFQAARDAAKTASESLLAP